MASEMSRAVWAMAAVGLVVGALPAVAAPTLTVTKTADTEDGVCNADCSLREAIAAAASGDVVDLTALPGAAPWTLTLSLGSSLTVGQPLTIVGPGAADLVVAAVAGIRVLVVSASGSLDLSGVTVRGATPGPGSGDPNGGCVKVLGGLAVDGVRFELCRAWSGGTSLFNLARGGEGGALWVTAGATLEVTDSVFTSNAAGQGEIGPDATTAGPGGRGGAIAIAGTATVHRTSFTGNNAGKGGSPNGNGGAGGAIAVLTGGSLLLADSTLSGNHSGDGNNQAFGVGADGAGGALHLAGDATLVNATMSDNAIGSTGSGTSAIGGALAVAGGTTRLRNVTVAGNVANGAGGGVARSAGTLHVRNSIVAANTSSSTSSEDCTTNAAGSLVSEGYNVVGVGNGCATSLAGSDQSGTSASPLAPGLGALAANGGPTPTRALLSTSPALDGGDPLGCFGWDPVGSADVPLIADQRGSPRPVDGDGDGTADCDAGAYEAPEPPKHALTVVVDGSGSGSVTSDPAGIACPDDCSEEYFATVGVDLTPTADPGSVFTGWSGDCAGSAGCTLAMSAERGATATFALLRSLTVTLGGDGGGSVTSDPAGIDCGATCGATFADGSHVALAATADPDSFFLEWSGDCAGSTCELDLLADGAVGATFRSYLVFASDFENGLVDWSAVVP
jgi:CSLREA domain-containing protein